MPDRHYVVVDGSNLATEGRREPSLAQLDEAVRAYAEEDLDAEIVVVVDATFPHRIAASERAELEEALVHGEVVAPPAGAVGRGDAFVLRIAERTGALVLSNDSFQEFHGEHPWLFEPGRLIGGKPVPGVGWIFTPRVPVRPAQVRGAARKAAAPAETVGASRAKAAAGKAVAAPAKAADGKGAAAPTKAPAGKGVVVPGKAPAGKGAVAAAKAADGKAAGRETALRQAPSKKAVPSKKPARAAQPAPAKKAVPSKKPARAAQPPPAKKLAGSPKRAAGAEKPPARRAAPSWQPAVAKAPGGRKPEPARKAEKASLADAQVRSAVEAATAEAMDTSEVSTTAGQSSAGRRPRRRRRTAPPPAVNEPLTFIRFVADHPLGSTVEGEVTSFTPHGAMVDVTLGGGEALHCYVPSGRLAHPPPRRAREVLRRGERRAFVLVSLDPARRAAELGAPDLVSANA